MDETKNESTGGASELRTTVRSVIEEFLRLDQAKTEPAYKLELLEERKKREQMEARLNELVEENRRTRVAAEEMERTTTIRTELQKLGVAKVDLAFRAVKDDIVRNEDGRLVVRTDSGELPAKEYLSKFLGENPELMPGRIPGGSGAGPGHKSASTNAGVDLDKIRPGMSADELERVRQEIARIAGNAIRGI
ncbi:MAG TPA: hypothetical protein VEQ63_01550 [Bryobacteraceae bacterium]|nr:hypothetical protein [Bryobacteraceae bacterium]